MWIRKERDCEPGITVLNDGSLFVPSGQEVYIERWPNDNGQKGSIAMFNWLKGWGTYIGCAGVVLVTLKSYLDGQIPMAEFITVIMGAFAGIRLRAAVGRTNGS